MPKDLPGLFWDEARNRYFPISSKPKTKINHQASAVASPESSGTTASVSGIPTNMPDSARPQCVRLTPSHVANPYHERVRRRHDFLASKIASTSKVQYFPVSSIGEISALAACASLDDSTRFIIGDSSGWLYQSLAHEQDPESGSDEFSCSIEINLRPSSEISSISISGPRCVATCSGTTVKVALINESQTTLFSVNGVHDAWSSCLRERSLVIGAEKKAVYIPDIDIGPPMSILDTHSDVFAVHLQENQIYTGARNGDIMRFDIRTGKRDGRKLFPERFAHTPPIRSHRIQSGRTRTSVVHLGIIREWQMLVSHMDGGLGTYDLRFVRETTPVQVFRAHVNSLTRRLAIGVDPCENFLFAAGEDRRIRAWSITTGELLQAPPCSFPHSSPRACAADSLFSRTFDDPVAALQVLETHDGLRLWATGPHGLFKYELGKQNLDAGYIYPSN